MCAALTQQSLCDYSTISVELNIYPAKYKEHGTVRGGDKDELCVCPTNTNNELSPRFSPARSSLWSDSKKVTWKEKHGASMTKYGEEDHIPILSLLALVLRVSSQRSAGFYGSAFPVPRQQAGQTKTQCLWRYLSYRSLRRHCAWHRSTANP